MRRNIPAELTEAMDSLHFSQEAKERMMKKLKNGKYAAQPRHTGKRLLAISLAAAAALVIFTGAAVYTRWSRQAQSRYNPSQTMKEQAQNSGLSVMLEPTQPSGQSDAKEILSATDQGITVTALQTMADEYGCELTFRVEGFQLPEGRHPWVWPQITIDGTDDFYSSMGGSFYDGLTQDENGNTVYASTGKPVEIQDGAYVPQYTAADGSMEFTIHYRFQEGKALLGKEIQVHIASFGQQSTEKAGMPEELVEGSWDLHWTLTGADNNENSVTITPNAVIGDSDLTLLDMEIGQKSIHASYKLAKPWDGWKELEMLSPRLDHIRMKDGTCVTFQVTEENYEKIDQLLCDVHYDAYDGLLDLSQLDAVAYYVDGAKDALGNPIYVYIPIE